MTTALVNPLQSLINTASQHTSLGEVSRLRQRQQQATQAVIILADISSSMEEYAGSRRKCDLVQEALAQTWPALHQAVLLAFASTVHRLSTPEHLPLPSGGTALHLALMAAQPFSPRQTLVISDGRPDSEEAALAAAECLSGCIDVIYCGPDNDFQAIEFLQRLARSTGGCYCATPRLVTGGLNMLAPVKRFLLMEGPCATS